MLLALLSGAPVLYGQSTLTLHEAVRLGLAASPEARASADRIAVSRAQETGARLRPNPRLFLSSEDLRPWAGEFSFPDDTEDFGYLTQSFELDGKRRKRVDLARVGEREAEAEHTLRLRELAGGIAEAYRQLEYTRAAAREWEEQLKSFDRLVAYQKDRVEAGAAAGVDLLRTELERDRAALEKAQAERDAEAAAIELARRTALPMARTAELADALEAEHAPPERPKDAVEARPDVAAAREAVEMEQADLHLQKANGVPDVSLLGGYKRDVGLNTLYGGLQIDLPFFNRNQGGTATAAANLQLAEDRLAEARLLAGAEIAAAESSYAREAELVRTLLPGMDGRARENARIMEDAYRSGGADLLRLLDAERTRADTRLLELRTWNEYQRAATALALAYGVEP